MSVNFWTGKQETTLCSNFSFYCCISSSIWFFISSEPESAALLRCSSKLFIRNGLRSLDSSSLCTLCSTPKALLRIRRDALKPLGAAYCAAGVYGTYFGGAFDLADAGKGKGVGVFT